MLGLAGRALFGPLCRTYTVVGVLIRTEDGEGDREERKREKGIESKERWIEKEWRMRNKEREKKRNK